MTDRSDSEGVDSEGVDSEGVDRLRTLGYAGWAKDRTSGNSGTVLYDAGKSCPGYNLYLSRERCMAELVDPEGRVVKRWYRDKQGAWVRCVLLADGDLLVLGTDRSASATGQIIDEGRFLMRLSWRNELRWVRHIFCHHDIIEVGEDRFLLLTFRYRVFPEIHPDIPVREDCISVVSGDGEVLECYSLYEMLKSRPQRFRFQGVRPRQGPKGAYLDLLHANSLHWMPESLSGRDPLYLPQRLIVTIRHQDTVAILDWQNKELVWAWGQGKISGPHDGQILPNGHLLVFDNGLARRWSRVVELDPLTRETVWEYKAKTPTDFFTVTRGANQRLANGNTLITNSDSGQAFEVTSEGQIVWEYLNPHVNASGRRATMTRVYRLEEDSVRRLIENQGN